MTRRSFTDRSTAAARTPSGDERAFSMSVSYAEMPASTRVAFMCTTSIAHQAPVANVTGTPPGVGMARKPPLFLKGGDVVEIEIDKLGVLRNPVVQGNR